MVATRFRARPEQGDDVGLGRTHTQLVSFVFEAADWNRHAPRLLANAGRWLRAEPDTVDFHERGDYPMAEFGPEQLPEAPPCEAGPLPPPGTLLWRLAAALENKDTNLPVGAADRIDSVPTFLRTLACTVALLPYPLRIYLTAAAGFREHQAPFAIQYLPAAPALPARDPSFIEQPAIHLLDREPDANRARRQSYWEELTRDDKDYDEAMRRLADQVLVRHPRSLTDLADAYPGLLKPRTDDQKSLAASVIKTLAVTQIATRHYYWSNESPPKVPVGLNEAARIVARQSFDIHLDDNHTLQAYFPRDPAGYLHETLRRYWYWALTPDADRLVWPAAIQGILEQLLSSRKLAETTNLLWRSYQPAYQDARAEPGDKTGIETASATLSEICLQALAPPEPDPVQVAVDLLRAIPDPAQPIPQDEPSRTFVNALWQRIHAAVADERIGATSHALEHHLLPVFAKTLGRILKDKDHKPLPETTRRLLSLCDQLLRTWLRHGIPPRTGVVEIFDQ